MHRPKVSVVPFRVTNECRAGVAAICHFPTPDTPLIVFVPIKAVNKIISEQNLNLSNFNAFGISLQNIYESTNLIYIFEMLYYIVLSL